jgi:hypothetical protein
MYSLYRLFLQLTSPASSSLPWAAMRYLLRQVKSGAARVCCLQAAAGHRAALLAPPFGRRRSAKRIRQVSLKMALPVLLLIDTHVAAGTLLRAPLLLVLLSALYCISGRPESTQLPVNPWAVPSGHPLWLCTAAAVAAPAAACCYAVMHAAKGLSLTADFKL